LISPDPILLLKNKSPEKYEVIGTPFFTGILKVLSPSILKRKVPPPAGETRAISSLPLSINNSPLPLSVKLMAPPVLSFKNSKLPEAGLFEHF
jgi:hypothetical protein